MTDRQIGSVRMYERWGGPERENTRYRFISGLKLFYSPWCTGDTASTHILRLTALYTDGCQLIQLAHSISKNPTHNPQFKCIINIYIKPLPKYTYTINKYLSTKPSRLNTITYHTKGTLQKAFVPRGGLILRELQ